MRVGRNMPKDKFTISLRENGEHSFMRSLESYSEYEKTKDQWLLKDTMMFLHQAIELLMKEMLVQHSPYLIFEELRDIPKKQKEANQKGIGIFFIDKPPRSVTYEVAIDRVAAFLNPPELADDLEQNLERLNRLRNQLEHYAIDADMQEVVQLLQTIHKPILSFFEKYLGPLTALKTPQVERTWDTIKHRADEYKRIEHEVSLLMQKFNGQKVPGHLFGVEEEVTLPKFDLIHEGYRWKEEKEEDYKLVYEFDIFAQTVNRHGIRWVVETKLRTPSSVIVEQVYMYGQITKAVPWLVVFDRITKETLFKAKKLSVMVTGRDELEELKKLVGLSGA